MQFLPSSCIKEPPRDSSSFSVPVSRWVRNGRIDLRPWIRNDWSSPGKGKCLLCNNLGTRSLGRLHFYASALALIAILWASGGPRASDGFQGWPFHRVFFFFFLFFLSTSTGFSLSTPSRKTGHRATGWQPTPRYILVRPLPTPLT